MMFWVGFLAGVVATCVVFAGLFIWIALTPTDRMGHES